MNNLSEIFEKRLNQMGLKRRVDAALVCEAFDKAVLEVFGKAGQRNVKAISFKESVLKVGVTSSSWASEISLRQLELVDGQEFRIIYQMGNKL